jgi:hypothetical protein
MSVDTCAAIDASSSGIGWPCVSHACVFRRPSGVSKPESLMIGIQYDAVGAEHRLGLDARQERQALRVQVLEQLLARDRARGGGRNRVQTEQPVQAVGSDLLARDALHVGLHRFPRRARSVRELGAKRQRRTAVIELEAHHRLRAHAIEQQLVGHPEERPRGLEADAQVGQAGELAARAERPAGERRGDRVGRRRRAHVLDAAHGAEAGGGGQRCGQAQLGHHVSLKAHGPQIYRIAGAASCIRSSR